MILRRGSWGHHIHFQTPSPWSVPLSLTIDFTATRTNTLRLLFLCSNWSFCCMQYFKKYWLKQWQKLCQLMCCSHLNPIFLEEFGDAGEKCTRNTLIHIDININGAFYYQEASESLFWNSICLRTYFGHILSPDYFPEGKWLNWGWGWGDGNGVSKEGRAFILKFSSLIIYEWLILVSWFYYPLWNFTYLLIYFWLKRSWRNIR